MKMNVNNLTPEQKQLIIQWVEDGLDLNAIQKRLNEDCDLRLTFMDTRFLLLDLGLEIKTAPKKESPADPSPAMAGAVPPAASITPPSAQSAKDVPLIDNDLPHGKLDLSLDDVTPPGMMVSGQVKFPSGAYGQWFLDNQYRVGIDPATASPEPTEKDMMIFEREIERFLRSQMGGL